MYYANVLDDDTFNICDSPYNSWVASIRNISSAGSDVTVRRAGPYIVVSDEANPDAFSKAKIMKVGYWIHESGPILAENYLSRGALPNVCHPISVWSARGLACLDNDPVTYDFRGGPEALLIQTRIPGVAT